MESTRSRSCLNWVSTGRKFRRPKTPAPCYEASQSRLEAAMTDFDPDAGVKFEVIDAVAHITLNRPERRNAVDPEMRRAILAAVAEVRDDPEIRAALVTGAGKAFCSGADLSRIDWYEIAPERQRGTPGHVARED